MTPRQLNSFDRRHMPEPNTGCWLWIGGLKPDGYARFNTRKTGHQMSFEHWIGKVPEGKEIDHICNMRCCVNPKHLQAITHKENIAKSGAWEFNRKKTNCPKGHPYSGDNLYVLGTNRQCKICRRAYVKAYRLRKKESCHR